MARVLSTEVHTTLTIRVRLSTTKAPFLWFNTFKDMGKRDLKVQEIKAQIGISKNKRIYFQGCQAIGYRPGSMAAGEQRGAWMALDDLPRHIRKHIVREAYNAVSELHGEWDYAFEDFSQRNWENAPLPEAAAS